MIFSHNLTKELTYVLIIVYRKQNLMHIELVRQSNSVGILLYHINAFAFIVQHHFYRFRHFYHLKVFGQRDVAQRPQAGINAVGYLSGVNNVLNNRPALGNALPGAVAQPNARSASGWAKTIEAMPAAINNTCWAVARNSVRLWRPGIRSATAT